MSRRNNHRDEAGLWALRRYFCSPGFSLRAFPHPHKRQFTYGNRGHGRPFRCGGFASAPAPSQKLCCPATYNLMSLSGYSRTNGYLQSWYFTSSAREKRATVGGHRLTGSRPTTSSRAAISKPQANLRLAEITRNRYLDLLKTHAIPAGRRQCRGTYNATRRSSTQIKRM